MSPFKKLMLTISVMIASLMQALDTTIANVALPHIQGSLSASSDEISWVLTSYITAAAISTLPVAWLSSKYGSKKIFSISIAGFTLASVLCGLSESINQIVFFRLIQGIFGAALVPLSQTTLLDINPPEKAGSAMALWGMGIMVGPIIGPSLGGYLTDNYNWRWVFYINVPFGILSFLGIIKFTPNKILPAKSFDKTGFAIFAIFLISLQLLLDRGNDQDWFDSIEINIYLIILLSSIWLLGLHLYWTKNSFINLDMFKDKNFSVSLILIFLVGIILLATMSILPPMLSNLLNYPITTVGLVMVPRGVGTMITMGFVGKLLEKNTDPRILITIGLLVIIITLLEMSLVNQNITNFILIKNGFFQGIGLGLVFVPLTTIAFSTINIIYRAEATGLFTLVRNIGSSIGISIISTLVIRSTQINHQQITSYVTKYNINDIAHKYPAGIPHSFIANILDSEITKQAQFISYLNCFKLMMYIIIITIPLVFFLKYHKRVIKTTEHIILE